MGIKSYIADAFGKVFGVSWDAPLVVTRRGGDGGDYHSPTDFTASIKGKDTVHLTGVAPTVTDGTQFECVRAHGPYGELIGEWFPSEDHKFNWTAATSYLVITGADFENAVSIDVELAAQHRAYAPTEEAYQSYIVNPEHAWTAQATLADVTNGADGAAVYYYVDADMYKYHAFQIVLDCVAGTVTATIEASAQDDGTAQAACAYIAVTNDLFGIASLQSAAAPATDMWVIDTPYPVKYLRIAIVAATGAATGDWTIYHRAVY